MGFLSTIGFMVVFVWVLAWKGYALWTAAKRSNKVWFVAIFLINTISILDMIYVLYVVKKSWKDVAADLKGFFKKAAKNK